MTQKTRKTKEYKRLVKMLNEYITSADYVKESENDPRQRRLIELGRKHMPFSEAIKIVNEEFPEE